MLFERSHVCGRFIDGEPSHWEPPLIWTGEGRIGGAKRIAAFANEIAGIRRPRRWERSCQLSAPNGRRSALQSLHLKAVI